MRYSQVDGVHTPLSKLVLYPRLVVIVVVVVCVVSTFVFSCVTLGTVMCSMGQ